MKRVLDVYFAWVQNATFFKKLRFGLSQTHFISNFKKLRFGLSQTHFISNFFIYARFGLQKVQTNAHLVLHMQYQLTIIMSRFHKLFTIKILSSAVVHAKNAASVGNLSCQMLFYGELGPTHRNDQISLATMK